jgi:hypothetical protein
MVREAVVTGLEESIKSAVSFRWWPTFCFRGSLRLNSLQSNLSRAYVFWIAALMFGLPLLTSFYAVSYLANSIVKVVVPYVAASVMIGLVILFWKRSPGNNPDSRGQISLPAAGIRSNGRSYKLGYISLFFTTLAVASYWSLRYFVDASYPSPGGELAGIMGLVYLVTVSLAAAFGIPFLLMLVFPTLKTSLSSRSGMKQIAIVLGVSYFVIYLLLVNQIVITGFNTPPFNLVPSPTGSYPFAFVFTSGPSPNSALESAFYVPQVTVQLNPLVNILLMPFELVLAIVLSTLVSASIVITYAMIKNSSRQACLTGAISGLGGFFGFTATCPMCLAPTLVSVFLGGVSATVPSFYSHLAGVVLPPLVSVGALIAGIAFLNFQMFRSLNPTGSFIGTLSKSLGGS